MYQLNEKAPFETIHEFKILKILQKEECNQTVTMVVQNSNGNFGSSLETHLVQPESKFVAARSLARLVLALSLNSGVTNIWSLIA